MTCPHCGSQQLSNAVVCLQCGTVLTTIKQTTQQKIIKSASVVILISVLFLGVGYFFATIGRTYHPVIDHQPSIGYGITLSKEKIVSSSMKGAIDGNDIVIPSEQVSNYRIVRINDPEGIQTVPILLYVTPRGKIVTAMSISESCRSNDFYLEGENIHCANCPSYWNMESLEAYACCQKYYPEPIPSTVTNGMVRIDKHLVQQWRTRL
ncbi:MAG: Fe-S-containing protein [Bacteriovoracaceae bacterium]